MLIYTIWVNSRAEFNEAWILNAWDEFTIDENSTGWEEAVKEAKDKYAEVRVIPIRVDIAKVQHAFEVEPIDGQVQSA